MLKIHQKKGELKLPFIALSSNDESQNKAFVEQHFSQFAFKKDFQRFVEEVKAVLKISAYSGGFAKLLQERLKSSIFRTKVSLGKRYFSSFECVKKYTELFEKLKKQ